MIVFEPNNDATHFLFIQHYTLQFSIFYSLMTLIYLPVNE